MEKLLRDNRDDQQVHGNNHQPRDGGREGGREKEREEGGREKEREGGGREVHEQPPGQRLSSVFYEERHIPHAEHKRLTGGDAGTQTDRAEVGGHASD